LNDAKLKPLVEIFYEITMEDSGRLCGWVLAHVLTGDDAQTRPRICHANADAGPQIHSQLIGRGAYGPKLALVAG
jgi:hypothetical protein